MIAAATMTAPVSSTINSRQNGGHAEVEAGLRAGLEKPSPHRFLPQIDHYDGQHDRAELFDQHQPEIRCMQPASEDQTKQQRDHRQAKQHHQPPANAEPPNETPAKQRARPGPAVGNRGDPQAAGNKINSVDASAKTVR